MKGLLSILFVFLFSNKIFGQTHDTVRLKLLIENLSDSKERHTRFWENIYELDQNKQNQQLTDSINERNLILTSFYVNKYGFPDPALCGKSGRIAAWVL
ncbi:MAG TPA: hypothetical protein VFG10_20590 [Saprospiraceae bacterium]|nr:hypothetical protein [Saprospiraceae bacterium]